MDRTPPRHRPFVNHGSPTSSLGHKRQRLDSTRPPVTPSSATSPVLPNSPYRFDSHGTVVENTSDVFSTPSLGAVFLPVPSDEAAMLALDLDAHKITKDVRAKERDDKSTKETYARHVRHYESFWQTTSYAKGDPPHGIAPIPALPVTVAKAVVFLQYESTRPQKKRRRKGADCDEDEGEASSVGLSGIKQVISALEDWRRHNHNQLPYKNIPEAQIGLRTDPRITVFESAAAHQAPERVKMAQALKAKGSSADTYTFQELIKCSVSCLTDSRGPSGIFVDVRDRAMLLTSTSVAFRGDSSRSLLWSDQFLFNVPILAKGLDATIPALTLIADNAKHNQIGRIEEYGAFRHRHVEVCPVGAIAALFFSWFHVLNCPVPDFKPDFTDAKYGQFGRRDWYSFHVFSHAKQADKTMTYDNHRDRLNGIYAKNDISISKVTHAGRGYAVKVSREHGASVAGAKALGGWSESGSFRPCYYRALPVDAMLGAAMFDAQRPETHFLPRESLLPPKQLLATIFPWVEQEQLQLQLREKENRFAKDIALMHFLRLMVYFRTVLIQDFAILFTKHPTCPIFKFPPFNSPCFREFAVQSSACITAVEQQSKLALANLPRHVAETFRGAVSNLSLDQKRERDQTREVMQSMEQKIGLLSSLLQQNKHGRNSRSQGELVIPPSLPSSSVVPPPSIDRGAIYPSASSHRAELAVTSLLIPSPSSPSSSRNHLADLSSNLPANSILDSPSDFCPHPFIPAKVMDPSPISLLTITSSPIIVGGIEITAVQQTAWAELAVKLNETRLRLHQWEWRTSGKGANSYIPYYTFQPVLKVTDLWTEWASGLNGLLAVRDLEEHWGALWRRDENFLKTEFGRRKKVIQLIQELTKKPNWNTALALRFIRDKYESNYTPRKFCVHLATKPKAGLVSNLHQVLAAADSYI